MKNKKIKIIIAFMLLTICVNAQDYNTGLGFRLGGINSGITVKHFTGSTTALEGIVGFARHSISITGLWEKHQAFPNADGLKWYYGAGAHVGFFSNGYSYGYYRYYKYRGNKVIVYDDDYYTSRTYIGVDFIIGLEYKFSGAPITVGLDAKPQIDFIPGFYGYFDGALTVRFTL